MQTLNDGARRSLTVATILLLATACAPDANDRIAAGDRVAGDPANPAAADRPDGVNAPGGFDNDAIARNDAAPGDFDPVAGTDDTDETAADAEELIDEAVTVVDRMQADPDAADLLARARGIFIIPDYAQAGLGVGGEGGEGIALLKRASAGSGVDTDAGADAGVDPAANPDAAAAAAGEWSSPAFFDFGGVTAGAEAGVEIGSVVMLLMSEEAADVFRTGQTAFSIDASAGLTIADFSARAEAAAGTGDIIVWSDTAGAFAGATVGINGVNPDEDETAAFYGADVDPQAILSGELVSDRARPLHDALSG
jgi:lipid-binding SYLF domain-containing protein